MVVEGWRKTNRHMGRYLLKLEWEERKEMDGGEDQGEMDN